MSKPKPPPPPRPDLDEQSFVEHGQGHSQTVVTPSSDPSPKPSKRLPPPIPLRPDLGEGIENNVSVPISPPVPKIPPPVMEKKPRSTKSHGRPEITIISAQPMTTPGIVSPSSLAPANVPSHPSAGPDMTSPAPEPPIVHSVESHSTATPIRPWHVADSSSTSTPTSISPIPPPEMHSKPKQTPEINKPIHPQPILSPSSIIDVVTPPSQPVISPSRATPIAPLKPTSPFSPSSSSTESPSPNRVLRTPKNREPPQRPKSKPVCELPSGEEESGGSAGIMNASIIYSQGESPIAPKRKKNKPNKSKTTSDGFDSSFGINNSAFFENEANEQDVDMRDNEFTEPASSSKAKGFPTVIRTKPNGKDNASVSQEPLQQTDKTENVTKAKKTKPTVIKPSVIIKPPPAAKKPPTQQNEYTEIPPQTAAPLIPPPEPTAKPKSRPTLIIPKAKKDAGNKAEETIVISPPEKPVLESQKEDDQDKKPSKTKRIPSIIRPNRLKKDTGSPKDSVESFRGPPEGECLQSQLKKGPVRRAPPPPRPAPPKPGPPRPGPPKKAKGSEEPKALIEATSLSVKFEAHPTAPAPAPALTETKPDHVKHSHPPEVKHRVKHPRPPTIGKDKESEQHRNIQKMKQKNEEKKPVEPVMSSVVSTKIEPSAIALYDYVPKNIDELSFKAGDEIFLIKRVDHEWYVGRCGDNEGMMPVKFVEIIEDLPHEAEEPSTSHKPSPHTSTLLSTVALYHFEAQSSDELSFHAGDTVHLLEMVNDEWLKGQSCGKIGIFPASFIDFDEDMKHQLQQKQTLKPAALNNIFQKKLTNKSSVVSSGPRCTAQYDYDSGNPDDLRFDAGDVIRITERINIEWLKGEIHGATGMFPAAYVDIIEDIPLQETAVKHALPVAKALHDYDSHEASDLSFKKGDRITIIKKINDDWLEGELNGHKGILPSVYVEYVESSSSTQHHEVQGHKLQPEDHLLPKGKALYDFTAELDSELSFKAGDEIILLKQINEEWMEGEFNNDIGQFPVAFIEILVPLP